MLKSRLLGSGSACRLLFFSSLTILVHLSAQKEKYQASNWIELESFSWPEKDKNSSAPFLVFHSEYVNNKILGLKKDGYKNDKWVTKPDLSFKYFASVDGYFRSRKTPQTKPERNFVLSSGSWESTYMSSEAQSSLRSISQEQWEYFGFENSDLFTLGLKDFSVKYVEKYTVEAENPDNITSFRTIDKGVELINFESEDSNERIVFEGRSAIFDNDILKDWGLKEIKINLKKTNDVEVTIQAESPNSIQCKVIPNNLAETFKNSACESGIIKKLEIDVTDNNFEVSKFSGKEKAGQSTLKKLKDLRSTLSSATPATNNYAVKKVNPYDQVKGIIRLSGINLKDDQDVCYKITKSDATLEGLPAASSVDVYLTLEKAPVGFKLDTIDNAEGKTICIFDYLALQKIDNYMITLVAQGDVSNQFKINVGTHFKSSKKVLAAPDNDPAIDPTMAKLDLINPKWFFYNSIFENIITSEDAQELFACDVISSCYPLEVIEDYNYRIPEKLKNEMAKSPFFQIRASPLTSNVKFAKSTTDQSKIAFNKQFIDDNKQFLTSKTIEDASRTELKYYLQFTNATEKTVSVSLDSIDMRFQELIMEVDLVKDESGTQVDNKKTKLFFNSITLKKSGEKEFIFPDDSSKAQISFEKFKGSTKEYFFVRPTKVTTGNSFKFNLTLDPAVIRTAPLFVQLKFQIQTIATKVQLETSKIDKVNKLSVIQEKDLQKSTNKISFKIKPNQTRFIYSNFIENAINTTKMADLKLSIQLTVKGAEKKTYRENYDFYRVILDEGNPKHQQIKTLSVDSQNNTVTITDGVNPKITSDEIVKGPFRVVYVIHSRDKIENTVEVISFNVEVVKTTDAHNGKISQSLANVDLNYEKAICVYGNDVKNDACTLKEFHRFSVDYCDMKSGCNNFFEPKLPTSTLYRILRSQNTRKFVPFQIDTPRDVHKLNRLDIPRRPSTDGLKPDFCVDFTYAAKTTPLTVFITNREELNTFDFPVTNEGKEVEERVCASRFTNLVKDIESISFTFNGTEFDIDHHYIAIKIKNDEFAYDIKRDVELKAGIYRDGLDVDSQFLEHPHWSFTKDQYNNSLIYKITAPDVTQLTANTQNAGTPLYYETLRSKWIKVPSENSKFKIGLKYTSDDKDTILYSTKAYVVSSFGDRYHYNLEDFKENALIVQSDATLGEYYRFEIEVVLNITKAKDLGDSLKPLVLTIDNISVNDPCVSDENKVEKCSSTSTILNYCHREYSETTFGFTCKCQKGFTGVTCEKKDYCYFASKSCLNCQNDYVFEGVTCDCGTVKKWNPFIKECIDPKELLCEENMRPQYNRDTKKIQCVCMDDYVAEPLNASTTVTKCVPFKPCILSHRKQAKASPLVPCTMRNATCTPTGSKTQPSDFQCKCDTGFYNEHDVYSSEKTVCLPDKCKSCSAGEYCKATGNDYTCTAKFCDIGFTYNETLNICQFNGKLFARIFVCGSETAELKDGKPVCKCAAGQRLSEQTQRCVKECDDASKAACQAKGAPICTWDETPATGPRPLCACKPTDIPYAEKDQKDANDWQCISRCSLLSKPDFSGARCTNSFEHCDESFSKSLPFNSLYPKAKVVRTTVNATNAPFINSVFVKNVTNLNVDKIEKRNGQKEYCSCDLGFVWNKDDGKCYPSTIPTHTITGFEFDLIHTSNEHNYIEKVRQAFMNLIAVIVGVPVSSLSSHTDCKKATDTTILCSTSFQSKLNDTQIADKLKAACVQMDNDKSKCYYVVDPLKLVQSFASVDQFVTFEELAFDPDVQSTKPDVLIHDSKADPQVRTQRYCEKGKNTCAKYAYSECIFHEKANKPFECLCPNSTLFQVDSVELVVIKDKGEDINLRLETCAPVNMCKADKDKYGCKAGDAQCHFQVEFDETQNGYKGLTYCTCPKSGITLSNRELSCEKTCDGYCSKNTASCGQDYLNTKIVCNCKEGFIGDKCEKKASEAKKDTEASSSKAYLISTIVVSVIAAIALIGLAVLYFKRR